MIGLKMDIAYRHQTQTTPCNMADKPFSISAKTAAHKNKYNKTMRPSLGWVCLFELFPSLLLLLHLEYGRLTLIQSRPHELLLFLFQDRAQYYYNIGGGTTFNYLFFDELCIYIDRSILFPCGPAKAHHRPFFVALWR